jgi:hypothetical protein
VCQQLCGIRSSPTAAVHYITLPFGSSTGARKRVHACTLTVTHTHTHTHRYKDADVLAVFFVFFFCTDTRMQTCWWCSYKTTAYSPCVLSSKRSASIS